MNLTERQKRILWYALTELECAIEKEEKGPPHPHVAWGDNNDDRPPSPEEVRALKKPLTGFH